MPSIVQDDRCTRNDYRQLFAGAAEPLRWLCGTLTGDAELSDKVLDAALEQSLKGADHVFRDWMVSWARRLIIKACIEAMRPWTSRVTRADYPMPMRVESVTSRHLQSLLNLPPERLQHRLLWLDTLSRFVFVLRALEGYSRHETALLLNIDDRTCEWTYVWAAEALESDAEQLGTPYFGLADDAGCFLAGGSR